MHFRGATRGADWSLETEYSLLLWYAVWRRLESRHRLTTWLSMAATQHQRCGRD
jgi:hypothetical protein